MIDRMHFNTIITNERSFFLFVVGGGLLPVEFDGLSDLHTVQGDDEVVGKDDFEEEA